LASEIGLSVGTISNYFEILEDSLLIHRIEPFLETKTRRQLNKTAKYLLFDLGVRQVAAKEPFLLTKEQQGRIFEQWVGLELLREIRMNRLSFKLQYWRDKNGIEVDWILSNAQKKIIPIEIKWTQNPKDSDVKHLRIFLKEFPEVEKAFLICNAPRAFEFQERITVLPWQEIVRVFF
jgi:predicted AAA+ superfamily ATPase